MKIIGNNTTKKQLNITLKAAKKKNMSIPHILFSGAAGCGKTSMARRLAKICSSNFIAVSTDKLKSTNAILKLLEKLNHEGYDEKGNRIQNIKPSILFFDEIHNMDLRAQEDLGIAMEEFKIPTGQPNKFYWVPYFTMIGATTNDGILSKPFRDRFKLRFLFQPYLFDEVVEIVFAHADRLKIQITAKAARAIARRGKGIPRITVGYLERAYDFALYIDSHIITSTIVEQVFKDLMIDKNGLTLTEIKILKTLYETDIPVGLDNLSIIVNEAPKTISASIEPFLIQKGLIIRSGKGRIITDKGRQYIEKNDHLKTNHFKKIEIEANYVRN